MLTLTPSQLDLPPVPLLISYNIKATEWIKQRSRAEYHLNSLQPVPAVNGGGSAGVAREMCRLHSTKDFSLCCSGSGLGRESAAAPRRRWEKGVGVVRAQSSAGLRCSGIAQKWAPQRARGGREKGKGSAGKGNWTGSSVCPNNLKKEIKWQEQGVIINIFKWHAHSAQMGLEGRCRIFKKSFNSQNIRCTFFSLSFSLFYFFFFLF